MSAPSIEVAPPELARRPFFAPRFQPIFARLELFLERERAQLAAWLMVAFAAGILAWFIFPDTAAWAGFALCAGGVAGIGAPLAPARPLP